MQRLPIGSLCCFYVYMYNENFYSYKGLLVY